MRFAVPTAQGQLALHFGHCEEFLLYDVEDGKIGDASPVTPPAHEPGVLPRFLAEQGVTHILAGGMGMRAQQLFSQQGIEVVVGAQGQPEEAVRAYLDGKLETGDNLCDH